MRMIHVDQACARWVYACLALRERDRIRVVIATPFVGLITSSIVRAAGSLVVAGSAFSNSDRTSFATVAAGFLGCANQIWWARLIQSTWLNSLASLFFSAPNAEAAF